MSELGEVSVVCIDMVKRRPVEHGHGCHLGSLGELVSKCLVELDHKPPGLFEECFHRSRRSLSEHELPRFASEDRRTPRSRPRKTTTSVFEDRFATEPEHR